MGHFNTSNSSLSDPTLSYKSGLGRGGGGGGVEGGLVCLGMVWGVLGWFGVFLWTAPLPPGTPGRASKPLHYENMPI